MGFTGFGGGRDPRAVAVGGGGLERCAERFHDADDSRGRTGFFINKLAYDLKVPFTTWQIAKWADPQRGDIIVFPSPTEGIRLVKRVVAVQGDRIELRDDRSFHQ